MQVFSLRNEWAKYDLIGSTTKGVWQTPTLLQVYFFGKLKSIQLGLWPCVCCDPTNTWCKRVLRRPQWCILSDVPLLNAMSFDGTRRYKKSKTRNYARSIEACSSRCKFPTLFRCFLTANALKISYSFRKENHRRRWYWKTTSAFGTYINEGYESF